MKHAHETGLIPPSKGEKNGRSKLCNEQVLSIRNRYVKGQRPSTYDLAKEYNVSVFVIGQIVRGKNWVHI